MATKKETNKIIRFYCDPSLKKMIMALLALEDDNFTDWVMREITKKINSSGLRKQLEEKIK